MSARHARNPRRRSTHGAVRIADVLKDQFREVFGKRGFAEMRLITHWPEIVGETFAKSTLPVKVGRSRRGHGSTLTIQVNGALAPILQMQTPEIMRRINAYYGYPAITGILLTQTSSADPGIPAKQFPDESGTSENALKPLPEDVQNAIDGLEDPDLRRAITALGKNVFHRRRHDDRMHRDLEGDKS